jgi:hypothetical protein
MLYVFYHNKKIEARAGRVTQVAEHLPSKREALSSNANNIQTHTHTKKKQKTN